MTELPSQDVWCIATEHKVLIHTAATSENEAWLRFYSSMSYPKPPSELADDGFRAVIYRMQPITPVVQAPERCDSCDEVRHGQVLRSPDCHPTADDIAARPGEPLVECSGCQRHVDAEGDIFTCPDCSRDFCPGCYPDHVHIDDPCPGAAA